MSRHLADSMSAGQGRSSALLVPMLLCATGVAAFAMMDAVMKGLSLAIGAYSALFWRSAIAGSVMSVVMVGTGNRWPPLRVLRIHILRSMVLAPMAWLFFWSLTRLPLAEAIALSFIAPIIALYLSALVLREHIGRSSILAAIIGLFGVVVIVLSKIQGDYDSTVLPGVLGILGSAIFYAFNLVLQRHQAQQADMVEISFFQNAVMFLILLPFAPWVLGNLHDVDWSIAAVAAICAIAAQMLFSRAYARAPASRLIPLEYTAFAWAALLGWLMFDEQLTWPVLIGVALIVTACLVAAREEPELVGNVEGDLP